MKECSSNNEHKDEMLLEQMFEKWESDIDQIRNMATTNSAESRPENDEDDSWKTISADTTPFSSSQASRGREQARDQFVSQFLRLAQMNEQNEPNQASASSNGLASELNPVEQLVRDVLRLRGIWILQKSENFINWVFLLTC